MCGGSSAETIHRHDLGHQDIHRTSGLESGALSVFCVKEHSVSAISERILNFVPILSASSSVDRVFSTTRNKTQGQRHKVTRTRPKAHGSRHEVRDTRLTVMTQRPQYMGHGTRLTAQGPWHKVNGKMSVAQGQWHKATGTCDTPVGKRQRKRTHSVFTWMMSALR